MSGDASARLHTGSADPTREATARPATSSDHAVGADTGVVVGQATPMLTDRHLFALQRQAGNAAVAAMIAAQRPARYPPAVQRAPVAAPPRGKRTAPPATDAPADAATLLGEQFPFLLTVLTVQEVAQIQRVLTARWQVNQLDEEYQQTEGLSDEGQQKLAALRARRDVLAENLTQQYRTLVVPTAKLLADDVLLSRQDREAARRGEDRTVQADVAYRDMLYTQLVSFPILLEINPGLKPTPLFTMLWGPEAKDRFGRGGMPNSGGQITWHDLMKVQEFSFKWIASMQVEKAHIELDMIDEAARASPGNVMYPLVEGKKLGERTGVLGGYGDVKVGHELGDGRGYINDPVGHAEMMAMIAESKTAKVIFERMNYLHVFQLEPNDALRSTRDLVTYAYDGWGYIRDQETAVPEPWKVLTTDGIELQRRRSNRPDSTGWGCPLETTAQTRVDQFFAGAFMGDFIEDQTGANVFGQLLLGMVPVVGEATVARDVAAGIHKMYVTDFKEGKLQTALNVLVLFLPVIGPLFRTALRSGKKAWTKLASRMMEEEAPKLRTLLARFLERDLAKAEKLLPEAVRAGAAAKVADAEAKTLMEAALKGNREAARRYAQAAGRALEDRGGNVASMLRDHGAKWADAVAALKQGGKDGERVGALMGKWRVDNVREGLDQALKRNAEAVGSAMSRDFKVAKLDPTGTARWTSDLDISIKGPHAGAQKMWAERWLTKTFGKEYGELLQVTVFTESTRLHAFTELDLGAGVVAGIEGRMVKQSEINVLAKMLHEGSATDDVMKYAQRMHPELARMATPEASQIWKEVLARKAFIEKLASDEVMKRALQLEIDALAGRLEKATNAADRAAIAETMADKQMKLNTIVHDAYATPGAGLKQISAREAATRATTRFPVMAPMSARMRYMAVIGELPMIEGVVRQAEKGLTPQTAKGLAKYADRLLITAGQLGGMDAARMGEKAVEVRGLYEDVEYLLLQKADPVKLSTTARPEALRALSETKSLLGDLIANSKAAEKTAPGAEKAMAHEATEALEEHLRKVIHIGGKLAEPKEREK